MANRTKRTRKKVAKFLETLTTGASVAVAAASANVGRATVYEWRTADTEFAQAWDEAVDIGTDKLEDEAMRRGRDGVEEPVFYKGARVSVVQKYSDVLLIFMLKARRPEKFKDRLSTELVGKDGTPLIPVLNVTVGDQSQPASKAG